MYHRTWVCFPVKFRLQIAGCRNRFAKVERFSPIDFWTHRNGKMLLGWETFSGSFRRSTRKRCILYRNDLPLRGLVTVGFLKDHRHTLHTPNCESEPPLLGEENREKLYFLKIFCYKNKTILNLILTVDCWRSNGCLYTKILMI